MLIISWYKYLFYRMYLWRCSRPATPISQPAIDAALLIAIANICYIGGIVFILAAFSNKINHILFDDPGEVKALVFVLGIIIALFHIYAFVWSASSEKIIKEFQDSKASRLGTCAVIFYMGFSCFFLVAAGLLLWPAIREKLPQI